MPEGVRPYPKWQGMLATTTRAPAITGMELRRALASNWIVLAAGLGLVWGAASIIELVQLRRDFAQVHNVDTYVAMLGQLRWFAVAAAAAIGGPIILEDLRSGAFELYFGRPVTRGTYLAGKAAAVLAVVGAVMLLPAVLYYLASLAFYDAHPERWHAIQASGLAYAAIWTLLVSGLALGVSCAARSARAAALLLFAGFVGLHIIASNLLAQLTEDLRWRILSPFAAMEGVGDLLFPGADDPGFPSWWGAVAITGLTIVGWTLVAWKLPRARGEAA